MQVGTIVPWKGHCALVISVFPASKDTPATATLLVWDGDGNAAPEWNVKQEDVDAARNPPAG
jgi:hypothetical protein